VAIALATFATYQHMYGDLNKTTVITVLAINNLMRLPMAIMPNAIAAASEALVSARRLDAFLFSHNEVPKRKKLPQATRTIQQPQQAEDVVIRDAVFDWSQYQTGEQAQRTKSQKKVQPEDGKSKIDEKASGGGSSDNVGSGGRFFLSVPELSVPRGALVAICGAVGSGKTTLINSIIGETTLVHLHSLTPS